MTHSQFKIQLKKAWKQRQIFGTPNTRMHNRSLSWLSRDTPIKMAWLK